MSKNISGQNLNPEPLALIANALPFELSGQHPSQYSIHPGQIFVIQIAQIVEHLFAFKNKGLESLTKHIFAQMEELHYCSFEFFTKQMIVFKK